MAPTDGSGNYSKPSGTTPSTGDVVESAPFNELMDDMAAGLSARVMANGSKALTANLPAGGFKVTGLGAATTNGDAVRFNEWSTLGTETGPGRIELATSAETNTATSTTLATHPAGVKSGILNLVGTDANIWAGTADKLVAAAKLVDAGAFVTLTDAATIATDCATGRNFTVEIDDSRNMGAPTNVKVGQVYTYEIVQGTGGSRTITWNAVFKFGDGTATLSTSEGDKDLVSFLAVSSTRFVFLGIRKAIQ
jgi:hypothetical protein